MVLAAAFAMLATAGADEAAAETFCAPAPCDQGTPMATIDDAVDAADSDPGPDTVAIQPGTHNTPLEGCGGLFVSGPDTTVRGAGIGETILTFPDLEPDDGFSRRVICGHMHLRHMTLRLPSAITPTHNSSVDGFDLYSGSIKHVRVDARGAEFGPGINDGQGFGGLVRSDPSEPRSIVQDLEVRLGLRRDTEGISLIDLPKVSNLDVVARDFGLSTRVRQEVGDPPQRIKEITIRSRNPMTVNNESGVNSKLLLSDAVLDASDVRRRFETAGIVVVNGLPPERVVVKMDRVTIVGNRAEDSTAMSVFGQGEPLPTVLRARHVIAAGFDDTLFLGAFGGDAKAILDHSNLKLGPRHVRRQRPDGEVSLRAHHIREGAPLFRDLEGGDFRLQYDSPAVDINGRRLLGNGPVRQDGDGDGRRQWDAGAFERRAR